MTAILVPSFSHPQANLATTSDYAIPVSTAPSDVAPEPANSRDVHLAAAAQRALLAEAELFPKPGLVDPLGHSTHPDMDLSTFIRSAISLGPAFQQFAALGRAGRQAPGPATLAAVRPVGIAAEAVMRRATGGANTHRGAIFILGLALAACGRVGTGAALTPGQRSAGQDRAGQGNADSSPSSARVDTGTPPTSDQVLDAIAEICRGLVTADLDAAASGDRDAARLSHGRRLYRELGVTGVRGEAEAGFPSVRPALAALRASRSDPDPALPDPTLPGTSSSPNSGHPPNSGALRPDFGQIRPSALTSAIGSSAVHGIPAGPASPNSGTLRPDFDQIHPNALTSAPSDQQAHPERARAARLDALLTLATTTADTTTLHRGGPAALAEFQQRAGAVLAAGGARTPGGRIRLRRLCRWATAGHLSLGGCADLLALAIFLDEVTAEPSAAAPRGSTPAGHASASTERRV